VYAKSILKLYRGEPVGKFNLPPELIPVDRIMQRWDTAHRGGYPMETDKDPISRPPALDDQTTIVVDDIVRVTPPLSRRIIMLWYRSETPNYLIARQLNCTPESLNEQYKLVLYFLRYRMVETGHLTLARLLKFRS
jgi:hypothetical protein